METTNATNETETMTIETYRQIASNGRHIRMATKVTLEGGRVIKFDEKMSKKEAVRQVGLCLAREANGAPMA